MIYPRILKIINWAGLFLKKIITGKLITTSNQAIKTLIITMYHSTTKNPVIIVSAISNSSIPMNLCNTGFVKSNCLAIGGVLST